VFDLVEQIGGAAVESGALPPQSGHLSSENAPHGCSLDDRGLKKRSPGALGARALELDGSGI